MQTGAQRIGSLRQECIRRSRRIANMNAVVVIHKSIITNGETR